MEIPNYAVERELGKGGMATVYLACQVLLNRQVALKVMSPEFSTDKAFQKAFLQEGKVVAQLEHPSIVKIYDIGIHDSTFYMAMEYLSGGSLRDRVKTEAFTPAAVLQMLRQLGTGLAYAHEQGFIHRDIKPENILFRKDGTAVLTDFGIAKVQDSIGEMTRMGYTTGTAQYMSPEQASTGHLDYRSDLYSLGLVVFEMLSGERVCKADSFAQAVYQHTLQPPPTLPVVYRAFQPVMQNVLAKQPEQRYRNVEAFVEAFAAAFLSLQEAQQATATAPAVGGDTAIFIPEQPADTLIFDPKSPILPSPSPTVQRAAETTPVLVTHEVIPWWKKPLFLTSLGGGTVVGLLALLFLPLLKPEPASLLPETPLMTASPPAPATLFPSTDKPSPIPSPPVPVPFGRQELGMKGRQFKVQTTDASLLILRSKPGRDSTEVAKLPVGTIVSVQGNMVYDDTIAHKKGRWLYVSALGNKGYVFDAYLKAVDASPTSMDSSSLKPYVIRNDTAKLYVQPTTASEGQILARNQVVKLIAIKVEDKVNNQVGHWLEVETFEGKTGYVFDQDVFPLIKTDLKGNKAVIFKFAPNSDTDILTTTASDRRTVYVLGASGGQAITIKPVSSQVLPAGTDIRMYVFGEDNTVLASNVSQVINVILPSKQNYYVILHWEGGVNTQVVAIFDITIKW